MPKPSAIDASTLLATKGKPAAPAVSGSLQRGQGMTETLVDLNFKVPSAFRQRFKRLALDAGMKGNRFLEQLVEEWERQQSAK